MLLDNYPNPFNASTTIRFQISEPSRVSIRVYDILGREIVALLDEDRAAGSHSLTWNAAAQPSGIYFYRVTAGNNTAMGRMMLLK